MRPVVALTAAQAVELAPTASVIVTDVTLPNGADGLELIAELWISMGKDLESESISEAEKKMLDERWARYESNPESALTIDEAKVRLAERLGR